MSKNDPAFPAFTEIRDYDYEEGRNLYKTLPHGGLSKRELLAGMCLQGMLANHCVYEEPDGHGGILMRPIEPVEVAEHAVKYADALTAELERTGGTE